MVFLLNAISMGDHLVDCLHTISSKISASEIVSQNLKDAYIVTIFKKKGDTTI